MIIWTECYNAFIMGGSCNYPGGCEVEPGIEFDLGSGFTGYQVIAPNGKTFVVESRSGAIVGNSIEEVRYDILTADLEVMKEQVASACERAKEVRVMEADKFWGLLKAGV